MQKKKEKKKKKERVNLDINVKWSTVEVVLVNQND